MKVSMGTLSNVKKNEPYFVYENQQNGWPSKYSIGYVDERYRWRIRPMSQNESYNKVYDVALTNRRELMDDNMDTFLHFVYGVNGVRLSGCDRSGLMGHISNVFRKEATDGAEWQDIVNTMLYRGDSNWRFDPILRKCTLKPSAIKIVRMPENPKKDTFDYIHVPIGLSGENKRQFVHDNYKEIAKRAVKMLSESKKFTKFGVPTNCLKVEKAVITCQDELILTFGLKNLGEKKGEA